MYLIFISTSAKSSPPPYMKWLFPNIIHCNLADRSALVHHVISVPSSCRRGDMSIWGWYREHTPSPFLFMTISSWEGTDLWTCLTIYIYTLLDRFMVCSFPPHVMSCQHFSTEKGYIDLRIVQRTHDRGLWQRGISEQHFSCSCILSPDPWGKNGKTWLPHALDCCLSHRYYPWWLQMTVSSREESGHGPVNNIYIYIYKLLNRFMVHSFPPHVMSCQKFSTKRDWRSDA